MVSGVVTRLASWDRVDKAVALLSLTIKEKVDAGIKEIHLPKIKYMTMSKIIEYCKKHVVDASTSDEPRDDDNLKEWDADFVKVDPVTLLDMFLAANNLQIKGLVDLTHQTLVNMLNNKTLAEVQTMPSGSGRVEGKRKKKMGSGRGTGRHQSRTTEVQ